MLTAMTRINISTVKPSCFKMKSDVDSVTDRNPATPEDHLDMASLLERLGLADIDYDELAEPEWCFPEAKCTEMASRHLSGGGLVMKPCETPTGRLTPAFSQSSQSSDDCATHPTNPFKNNNMLLVLEADEVLEALEEEIDQNFEFSSMNPFSRMKFRDPVHRTLSQCSTRAVSPVFNPFQISTMSQSTQTGEEVDRETRNIQVSVRALGRSGWYHGDVSWQDSIILLQGTQPGTFFIRDSADPNFLFSLSLQTVRGPTSVRLHHVNGLFRLDSEAKIIPSIPSFESVVELVEYYVEKTEKKRRKSRCHQGKSGKEQVWVDVSGQVYSSIRLMKPMGKPGQVPQLQHLSRLHVNGMLRKVCNKTDKDFPKSKRPNRTQAILAMIDKLDLPSSISSFLKDYPYTI